MAVEAFILALLFSPYFITNIGQKKKNILGSSGIPGFSSGDL